VPAIVGLVVMFTVHAYATGDAAKITNIDSAVSVVRTVFLFAFIFLLPPFF
jgi:hypothetical protein